MVLQLFISQLVDWPLKHWVSVSAVVCNFLLMSLLGLLLDEKVVLVPTAFKWLESTNRKADVLITSPVLGTSEIK